MFRSIHRTVKKKKTPAIQSSVTNASLPSLQLTRRGFDAALESSPLVCTRKPPAAVTCFSNGLGRCSDSAALFLARQTAHNEHCGNSGAQNTALKIPRAENTARA